MIPEVHDIALRLMAALNCPRSLTVAILIRSGEWRQLAELRTNPHDYDEPEAYLRACQASDFLRKYQELPFEQNREAEALRIWEEAETRCFWTNRRLNEIMDFGTLAGIPCPDWISTFVSNVRKIIWTIVGSEPPRELTPRFGPGATVSDRSGACTVPDKIASVPTLTLGSAPFATDWISTAWGRAASRHLGRELRVVRGNHFFTVPKDAIKDRSCGKEPSLNVAYQLALGRAIRSRLRKFGYDLDRLQDTHRALAREGSRTGRLATIDLSAASDCMSTSLVRMLMPPEWHRQLSMLRSPFTEVKGDWRRLEKFSSMGNGYTFELETLIFLAISLALTGEWDTKEVSVFGDDIIVPTRHGSGIVAALKFFGFETNLRKTFLTGSFRESCGGDFFEGVGVRPYLQEKEPSEPQDYISMANGLRRMALQFPGTLWPDVRRVWFRIHDCVPSHIRQCRGPEILGDLVFHDEERTWTSRWRGQIRYLRVYRPVAFKYVRWEGFAYEVQYAAALYGVTLSGPDSHRGWGCFIVPRDGVAGYAVRWLPHS